MKKAIISVLTVFILFIFQTSVFHHLAFNGIIPNLLIIAVCAYGFLRGETEGIIAGFFCGLLVDIFYADYWGFHSIIYLYIGFFNGLLNRFYIDEDYKLSFLCVGLSDILVSVSTYCLQFLLHGKFNIEFYIMHIMIPELIYTLGISIVVFPMLVFIEYKVIPFTFIKDKEDVV